MNNLNNNNNSNGTNPIENTNQITINVSNIDGDNNSNGTNPIENNNEIVMNVIDNKSENQKKKENVLKQYIQKRRDNINSTIHNNNKIESVINILVTNTHSLKNVVASFIEYLGIIFVFIGNALLKSIELCYYLITSVFEIITHGLLNALPELLAIIVYSFQSMNYKLDNPNITYGMISFISSYGLLFSKGAIKRNVSKLPILTNKNAIIARNILLSILYLGKIAEIGLEIWYATLFNKTYSGNITYTVLCSILPIFTTLYYVLMPYYLKNYCNYIELLRYYNLNDKVNLLNNKIDNMLLNSGNILDEPFVKFTEYNEHKCENDECNECICSICYTKDSKKKVLTKCNHIYDTECIDKWLHTDIIKNNELTCPMCRADLFEYNDENSTDINSVLNNV